jgi:hypothetical protein
MQVTLNNNALLVAEHVQLALVACDVIALHWSVDVPALARICTVAVSVHSAGMQLHAI